MMHWMPVWFDRGTGLLSNCKSAALACAGLVLCASALQSEGLPDSILRRREIAASEQIIVVFAADGKQKMQSFSRTGDSWKSEGPAVSAVIGYRGFAVEGAKREGDGKTPTGIFTIGTAFGYAPFPATRLPFRVSTASDYWVDDPQSPQYNTWIRGKYIGKSAEKMLRQDRLYKLGLVIEYNTSTPVAGHGSAIFLHIWSGPSGNTAGCVAVSEEEMTKILKWLDPSKHMWESTAPETNRAGTDGWILKKQLWN